MPIGNALTVLKSVKIKVPMVEEFVTNVFRPRNLVIDSNDNVFVAYDSKYIDKIDPNGTRTAFATVTNTGSFDISDMTIDNLNNIYIADGTYSVSNSVYNHDMYKIDSLGVQSVYVNITTLGSTAICIDKNNNLYYLCVTNPSNSIYILLKCDFNKNQTIVYGTFTPNVGYTKFFDPSFGVALDSKDNLFVSETNKHKIWKVDQNGILTLYAGSTQGFLNGNSANAKFNRPTNICFDEYDNLYVLDSNNARIRKITLSGEVSTIAGNGIIGDKSGVATQANFNFGSGGSIKYKNGIIYITEWNNNKVKKLIL